MSGPSVDLDALDERAQLGHNAGKPVGIPGLTRTRTRQGLNPCTRTGLPVILRKR